MRLDCSNFFSYYITRPCSLDLKPTDRVKALFFSALLLPLGIFHVLSCCCLKGRVQAKSPVNSKPVPTPAPSSKAKTQAGTKLTAQPTPKPAVLQPKWPPYEYPPALKSEAIPPKLSTQLKTSKWASFSLSVTGVTYDRFIGALESEHLDKFNALVSILGKENLVKLPFYINVGSLMAKWPRSALHFALMSDEKLKTYNLNQFPSEGLLKKSAYPKDIELFHYTIVPRMVGLLDPVQAPVTDSELENLQRGNLSWTRCAAITKGQIEDWKLKLPHQVFALLDKEVLSQLDLSKLPKAARLTILEYRFRDLSPETIKTYFQDIPTYCLRGLLTEQVLALDFCKVTKDQFKNIFDDGYKMVEGRLELLLSLSNEDLKILSRYFEQSHVNLLFPDSSVGTQRLQKLSVDLLRDIASKMQYYHWRRLSKEQVTALSADHLKGHLRNAFDEKHGGKEKLQALPIETLKALKSDLNREQKGWFTDEQKAALGLT